MTTTIQKWGNSQGIRIPKHILTEMKISENEKLDITINDGKIIIQKSNKKQNIKELFADFKEKYDGGEIDFGEKTGKEIW